MARFSQQEQNAMHRDAVRRAQEMQQRVHPSVPFGYETASKYADYPPEPPVSAAHIPHDASPQNAGSISMPNGGTRWNPSDFLSHLDSDSMLILAMMAMIYKDGGKEGCDRKLLMALAYLLT